MMWNTEVRTYLGIDVLHPNTDLDTSHKGSVISIGGCGLVMKDT